MKEESPCCRFLNGFGIFGPSRIQPRSFKVKILLLQDFDVRFAQTTSTVVMSTAVLRIVRYWWFGQSELTGTKTWPIFVLKLRGWIRLGPKIPKPLRKWPGDSSFMFNCHFGFSPEEGSSTYWTQCTPYIRCQVDQVQDLTILLPCRAYSSLTTGLFYWQPWFLRSFAYGSGR